MDETNFNIYQITEEKEQKLFKNAYVFFDTSALLDFYYFSDTSRKEIFQKVFKALKNRLWITSQSEYEFFKNREKVFKKPIETYDALRKKNKNQKDGGHIEELGVILKEVSDNINSRLFGQLKTLKEKTTKNDKHPFLEDQLFVDFDGETKIFEQSFLKYLSDFEQFKKRIEEEIELKKENLTKTLTNDIVLEEFKKYFQTTSSFSYSEILKIVVEGEIRYKNEIPPGYLDEEEKIGFQKFGDLILWKEIIAKSRDDRKDVILVINDLKEDWWYYSEKETPIGPRHELIKEIHDESGQHFWMYNINSFLFKSKQFIATNIEDEVINDVKNVTQPKFIFDKDIISNWIITQFTNTMAIDYDIQEYDNGIDYRIFTTTGDIIGFIHKSINKTQYTGLYLPLKNAFEHIKSIKSNLGITKWVLVIESTSHQHGINLIKHIGRKSPQGILNSDKENFRLIIVTRDSDKLITIYDSESQNIS